MKLRLGTRSSALARIQAELAVARFNADMPSVDWKVVACSSPGDRDQKTDLRESAPDFFTKDLDDAVLAGTLDAAIHSAKDLPDPVSEGLDWFWLSTGGDARDVIVGSLSPKTVGVSSDRRAAYAQQRFPDATLVPLRGAIEQRLAQIESGHIDTAIMAGIALQRLGLDAHIREWIALEDLAVPDGQGILGITFRAGDQRFRRLRTLMTRPVDIVSAGTAAEQCTIAGVRALSRADVCLYDALSDDQLLSLLPKEARRIYVGKRSGAHHMKQEQICRLLQDYARQGYRVVRLKGGDAGWYGRLAEEVEALDSLGLAYRVWPGVSSLQAATTGTGLLLTRRQEIDRVHVMTGHHVEAADPAMPIDAPSPHGCTEVIFMGTRKLDALVQQRIDQGLPRDWPVSVVYAAGTPDEQIISGTLATIVSQCNGVSGPPGLILLGQAAASHFRYHQHGALQGRRIWLTCSEAIQERAAAAVLDYSGVPLRQPLIELVPQPLLVNGSDYDWLVISSPSAVRSLMTFVNDTRSLPRILCCGKGTAKAFEAFRVVADAVPEQMYNTEGMLAKAFEVIPRGARILRLRSDRAGTRLSDRLVEQGYQVDDVVICENRRLDVTMPPCDAVFFASVSGVDSFVSQFGIEALGHLPVVVIGRMDGEALQRHGVREVIMPEQATVESAVAALARAIVEKELLRTVPVGGKGKQE